MISNPNIQTAPLFFNFRDIILQLVPFPQCSLSHRELVFRVFLPDRLDIFTVPKFNFLRPFSQANLILSSA